LQRAKNHDYAGFYANEIKNRAALNYPPFCRLVRLVVRATKDTAAQNAAETLAVRLEEFSGLEVLGPAPAAHLRLRGQFRYQLLVKGQDEALAPFLKALRTLRLPKAFLMIDVDPLDML
jgi:primosomal protein N' (replication factor Y)